MATPAWAAWTNLWGDTLTYTEDDGPRIIDQGQDSLIMSDFVVATGDQLIVTILTDGHNCCTRNHGVGCSNTAIQGAVCEIDSYCCTASWDTTCIGEVPQATGEKYFCPDDWQSEKVVIDNLGQYGGEGSVSYPCGGSYVCYKLAPLASVAGGGDGRDPLRITMIPGASWGPLQLNYVVRSFLYDNSSQDPDTHVARSLDIRYVYSSGAYPQIGLVYLTLIGVNDPPVVVTNAPAMVAEGGGGSITGTNLLATDPDSSQIFWTLRAGGGPTDGVLQLSGAPADWVRQSDISSSQVRYQHNGDEAPADTMTFEVTDTHNCCVNKLGTGCSDAGIQACVCAADSFCCGTRWDSVCVNEVASMCGGTCGATAGTQTFTVDIIPVNDPPVLVTNAGLDVAQGATGVIDSGRLAAVDADNTPPEILFTVTSLPSRGTLLVSGFPPSSFTQADLDAGVVTYEHDGSETIVDSFTFSLSDDSGASGGTGTFSIAVHSPALADILDLAAERLPTGVLVSWRTGSEVDCGAFTLLRCDLVESGCTTVADHAELNGIMVPCEGSPAGSSYHALDATALASSGYSYYLRAHEATGGTHDFGPAVMGPAGAATEPAAPPVDFAAFESTSPATGCSVGGRTSGALPVLLVAGVIATRRRRRPRGGR
jgi:hypothetical protein